MKKPWRIASVLVLAAMLLAPPALAADMPHPSVAARAWLLMDVTSGQVLAASNAGDRMEPASLTKLMTAYVVFTALREKRISLEQTEPILERLATAQQKRGSR